MPTGDGKQQDVSSSHVNAYLQEITGQDITAKDFRTWAGTVLAALALKEFETFDTAAQAKRNLRAAMVSAGAKGELDGYIGYFKPYATSHEALDDDTAFQKEVTNATTTLLEAVEAMRSGRLVQAGSTLKEPRPK